MSCCREREQHATIFDYRHSGTSRQETLDYLCNGVCHATLSERAAVTVASPLLHLRYTRGYLMMTIITIAVIAVASYLTGKDE